MEKVNRETKREPKPNTLIIGLAIDLDQNIVLGGTTFRPALTQAGETVILKQTKRNVLRQVPNSIRDKILAGLCTELFR